MYLVSFEVLATFTKLGRVAEEFLVLLNVILEESKECSFDSLCGISFAMMSLWVWVMHP